MSRKSSDSFLLSRCSSSCWLRGFRARHGARRPGAGRSRRRVPTPSCNGTQSCWRQSAARTRWNSNASRPSPIWRSSKRSTPSPAATSRTWIRSSARSSQRPTHRRRRQRLPLPMPCCCTTFPEQAATLDSARASSLARIPNGPAKDAGIGIGEAAATAMIERRMIDGSQSPEFHVPPSDGSRRMAAHAQLPTSGRPLSAPAKRCALRHRAQRSISSGSSSIAYQPEVREGLQRSEGARCARQPEQAGRSCRRGALLRRRSRTSDLEFAAQQVAIAQKRSISENARAFALLNMALFDATICGLRDEVPPDLLAA